MEKSRGLRTVASAPTLWFARRGIVEVEHATLCSSVESESIFYGSNFLVQACQTRSSRRCISYTKRTPNCVSANRALVVSEFYQVSPSRNFSGILLALWVCEICNSLTKRSLEVEARVGIEPTMQLLQSRALPLGYPATGTQKLSLFAARIKLCFSQKQTSHQF